MSLFAQILSFDFFNLFALVPGTERDGSKRACPLDWWDSGVAQNSEYQSSTLAGGSLPVVFLPSSLVAAKQAGQWPCAAWAGGTELGQWPQPGSASRAEICQASHRDEAGLRSSQDARSISSRSAGTWPGMDTAPARVSAAWSQARQLGSQLAWAQTVRSGWGTVSRASS